MAKPRLDDPLTAEQLRAKLDYIPITGVFFWRHRQFAGRSWNTRYAGTVAGALTPTGYIQILIRTRLYLAHRLAFLWMTGAWPRSPEIDHIDGDRTNNAWSNLREATRGQNAMNYGRRSDNTSGVKGVRWEKRRNHWVVEVMIHGHKHYIGSFATLEEAKAARIEAANRLHGQYARHD